MPRNPLLKPKPYAKWVWIIWFVVMGLWLSSAVFVERYLEANLPDYWIAVLLWLCYLVGSTYAFFKFTKWYDLEYQHLYADELKEPPKKD